MNCPHCQWQNYENARFCTRCGCPLTPPAPSPVKRGFLAFLRALCYYFLFIVMQSAVILVYEFALAFSLSFSHAFSNGYDLNYEDLFNTVFEQLLEQLQQNIHIIMILAALLTVLVVFISFRLRHKKPLEETHIRKISLKNAPLCVLFGMALQIFVSVTIALLPLPQSLIESFAEGNELLYGGPFWIEFISVVLVTPIIEELIFRGLVFTRLRRGMKTWLAILLSAVIFGWAHGHIISFVYAGLLGVLFALLMLKNNDSIVAPMLCHAGFNGASYLIAEFEAITLPVMALYFAALAVTVVCGYLLFRKPAASPAPNTEKTDG